MESVILDLQKEHVENSDETKRSCSNSFFLERDKEKMIRNKLVDYLIQLKLMLLKNKMML